MAAKIMCSKSVNYTRNINQEPNLLIFANQQRINGFLNDVQLKAGNQTISANRLVLACYSKHFNDQFITQSNNSIVIDGIGGQSLKTLIDYIYDGNIVINNINVFDLISAAHKLKLTNVVNYCCEFLQSVITYDSCLYVLNAAKLCQNIALQQTALKHLNEHFEKVSLIPTFKKLSQIDLIHCISHLNRDELNETTVYEAILRWSKDDEDRRRNDFPDLFQQINLDRIPDDYLRNVVFKEELVRKSVDCLNKILDFQSKTSKENWVRDSTVCLTKLVDFQSKPSRKSPRNKTYPTRARSLPITFSTTLKSNPNRKTESAIVSLGGYQTPSKVTEIFSLTDNPPKLYPDLPMKFEYHSSLKLNNFIYWIGGRDVDDKSIVTNQVWRMDVSENDLRWEETKPMLENRRSLGAAVCFDSIVVSHGYNDDCFSSVSETNEVYENSSNQWRTISSLQQTRRDHQLVDCGGKLLAIGGINGRKALGSVEQLSDLTSTWKYKKSMSTPRCWFAAVNCEGYVYVIGGKSDQFTRTKLKSVERYDHVANTWDSVSDMKVERSCHSACVLQNKIYVVGGRSSNGKIVKEIECYDPSRDSWTIVGETKDELNFNSLIVV